MLGEADDKATPVGWHFGAFELYPAKRRLLRDHVAVNVEERTFDLLVLLARNHQREIDRREVTETLWGSRPVSDNTLRQLVYKARRAVDDDGERQEVIRTLHGRSLQWVAPIEELPTVIEVPDVVDVPGAVAAPEPRKRRRLGWLAVAVLVVAAGAAAFAGWSMQHAKAPQQAKPLRLVIAPFVNQSGDTAMDWTADGLPGLLASLLSQSGGVDVVDPLQSARAWRYQPQQGRSRDAQLLYNTGATALVGGQLRKLTDNLYELKLSLVNGNDKPREFVLTGAKPGQLAVDAVSRVRRALALDKPVAPGKLPRDAFLAEAYARGMGLATQGKWNDAIEYFRLCVKGAPGFLPGAVALGTAQARTDDMTGSETTLLAVVARASREGDVGARGRAQLELGHLARTHDDNRKALVHLRHAVADSHSAKDMNIEIEARALLADVLHKLQQPEASRKQMLAAQAMAKAHPELRIARGLLYDSMASIALDDGDVATALKIARDRLDLNASFGDERAVANGMFNVANDLRNLHRDAESLAVSANCYRRAVAGNYLSVQFGCAANFTASLLDLGLPKAAIAASGAVDAIAKRLGIAEYRVLALQLRSLGEIQQGDYHAALTDLRQGSSLIDLATFDSGTVLQQDIYEAIATFKAAPEAMLALSRRFDAQAQTRQQVVGYVHRGATLRALAATAAQRPPDALRELQVAANAKPLAQDGDVEIRMSPLLVALANHDRAAAGIALKGYNPATTNDASILPLYIKWAGQQGDAAGAARAQARLGELRKQGTDALAAAGLDPDDPLGVSPVARAVSTGGGGTH